MSEGVAEGAPMSGSDRGHETNVGGLKGVITKRADALITFDTELRKQTSGASGKREGSAAVNSIYSSDVPGITLTAYDVAPSGSHDRSERQWGVAVFEDPRNTGGRDFPEINLLMDTNLEGEPTFRLSSKDNADISGIVGAMSSKLMNKATDIINRNADIGEYSPFLEDEEVTPEVIEKKVADIMGAEQGTTKGWREANIARKIEHPLQIVNLLNALSNLPPKGAVTAAMVAAIGKFQDYSQGSGQQYSSPN
ncbi:MAG TPA: hypothetical protein VNW29_02860 [Candidatus Sulfotelmatobacter sp.]|jgi:hypothetical protein|nr:hypothetical protein [Candidatus Sulfotelmatobacter sp.]